MPKTLPEGLKARQAKPSDIPSIARLLAAMPDDGSLYQFPHLMDHAEEMYALHVKNLAEHSLVDPTLLVKVATVPGEEGGEDEIVGFSSWGRRVNDEASEDGRTRALAWPEAVRITLPSPAGDTNNYPDVSKGPSKALAADKKHQEAVKRTRKRLPPSPMQTTPCYELSGLAVRASHQGLGVGTHLTRTGLAAAAADGVPVFVTGEARGVDFYERALGFQRIEGSEFWLDAEGNDVAAEDVGDGLWKRENGGLSGAEMVWCPAGATVEIRGRVYTG